MSACSAAACSAFSTLDPQTCNWALFGCLQTESNTSAEDGARVVEAVEAPSTVAQLKAAKNEAELKGMRAAHVRDGAALVRYFSWLEATLHGNGGGGGEAGAQGVDECFAADKLEGLRADECICDSASASAPTFVSPSFDTISAFGGNGAIVHYKPEKETCSVLEANGVYLCDSGGQYLDGTTDITRTVRFVF